MRHEPGAFPNISPRWLLKAFLVTLGGILILAWFTLCLLYWQGSWQLLYHPKAVIARTPANTGLTYNTIRFAVTETGTTQLTGWWLPAPMKDPERIFILPGAKPRKTVLYLHGSDSNLSDTVDTLAALHNAGLAVFAIDYRGYGQSQPARPSEKHLRQDAESALTWLTNMRQIQAKDIVVYGTGLGANLAGELAAAHSDLAGVILDQPLQDPMKPVFTDPRSRLVPAHWLIQDRYDLSASSASLHIPSIWLLTKPDPAQPAKMPAAYQDVSAKKSTVWLESPTYADPNFQETIRRLIDDL